MVNFKNIKIQKIISFLIFFVVLAPSFIIFSLPKTTQAIWGVGDLVTDIKTNVNTGVIATNTSTGTVITVKNALKEIGKQLLMAAARKVLAQVTKSTVNWINTGNFGKPLFLTNTGSFFRDIAKNEIKNFVNLIGYDSLKYPFGRQIALNSIRSVKNQFETNAQYTLSAAIADPEYLRGYRNRFDVGGWDAFLINTQYPQNNYIGSGILASEYLAKQLDGAVGTVNSTANKVRDTLQQSGGFLSPQICKTNPAGRNYNPYNPPSFDAAAWQREHPYKPPLDSTDPNAFANYNRQHTAEEEAAKANWEKTRGCPNNPNGTSGLATTTPGGVIADQLKINLGSGVHQKELAAAMGNSLSAVFDALINKLMSRGLNALARGVNNTPDDNFSYGGETLGTPDADVNGGSDDWFNAPDEIVTVASFKEDLDGKIIGSCTEMEDSPDQYNVSKSQCDDQKGTWTINSDGSESVRGAIALTKEELLIMDNPPCSQSVDPTCNIGSASYVPGIIQVIQLFPTQVQALDQCLPGPNKGWEDRLQKEMEQNSSKLLTQAQKEDEKADDAANVIRELRFAVASFKDWINEKMISSLPDAITYLDAIKSQNSVIQQSAELTNKRRDKAQTLARLEAIKRSLDSNFPTNINPGKGTPLEKQLIALRKNYNAIKDLISNEITIEDSRNELNTLLDRQENYTFLNNQCSTERRAAKWATAGDATGSSVLVTEVGKLYGINRRNIDLTPDETSLVRFNKLTTLLGLNLDRPGTSGKEIDLFCELPIIGGYGHGDNLAHVDTIVPAVPDNPDTPNVDESQPEKNLDDGRIEGYTFDPKTDPVIFGVDTQSPDGPLPMVNADNVFRWKEVKKHARDKNHNIDVNITCNVIWRANKLDYKYPGDATF